MSPPPLALFVYVVGSARSRSCTCAYQSAFASADQTSGGSPDGCANANPFGGFGLARLRVAPVMPPVPAD